MSDEVLRSEARPVIQLPECIAIGKAHQIQPPFLLGIRGYEMPGQNARGTYDDCICVVDTDLFKAFNANTDPSKFGLGMATVIAPQIVLYKIGIHGLNREPEKRYEALVQASTIRVTREGIGEVPPGWFGINIHRGGKTTPGSEGCQTIPPGEQWDDFMLRTKRVLMVRSLTVIKYLLVER